MYAQSWTLLSYNWYKKGEIGQKFKTHRDIKHLNKIWKFYTHSLNTFLVFLQLQCEHVSKLLFCVIPWNFFFSVFTQILRFKIEIIILSIFFEHINIDITTKSITISKFFISIVLEKTKKTKKSSFSNPKNLFFPHLTRKMLSKL